VAVYTHLAMLMEFFYWNLSPYFVLLWMDVKSLAYFHVATRFPLLLGTLPAMLTDVMAPGLSALDASGSRDRALRQAGNVIKAALIPTVPAALAFIFFAGDGMAMFNPEFRDHRNLPDRRRLSAAGPCIIWARSSPPSARSGYLRLPRSSSRRSAGLVWCRGSGCPGPHGR
jgi:hypothetical protein